MLLSMVINSQVHSVTGRSSRYPTNTPLTMEAFKAINLDRVLPQPHYDYQSAWQALNSEALAALEAGEREAARVLWLFSDVCEIALTCLKCNGQTLIPALPEHQKLTTLADLEVDEVVFLLMLSDQLGNYFLKSLLAEVL